MASLWFILAKIALLKDMASCFYKYSSDSQFVINSKENYPFFISIGLQSENYTYICSMKREQHEQHIPCLFS